MKGERMAVMWVVGSGATTVETKAVRWVVVWVVASVTRSAAMMAVV